MVKFNKLKETVQIEMELLNMRRENSEHAPLISIASEGNSNAGMEDQVSLQTIKPNVTKTQALPAIKSNSVGIETLESAPPHQIIRIQQEPRLLSKEFCSKFTDMYIFYFLFFVILLIIVAYKLKKLWWFL